MAISRLIKYEGDNSTFIWKYPHEDFNYFTQIIVHQSQQAIFVQDGRIIYIFGPGRHKLNAKNIPFFSKAVNFITGVSVIHCEVYYINMTVQMGIKWGTDSKVRLVEPTANIPVEIGASGEMNLKVIDGHKLLVAAVGTMNGIAWDKTGNEFTKSLQNAFRGLISTAVKVSLPVVIKDQNIDIVDIDMHLHILSSALCSVLEPGFKEYGLSIQQLYITNVVLPEDDENFRQLKELHTVALQKKKVQAEAEVKKTHAEEHVKVVTAEREIVLENQTTDKVMAEHEAEMEILQAKTEAEVQRIKGYAEADVMRAKGYTQKDVFQAEAQKAYAQGIGNLNAAGSSTVNDVIGLGIGIKAVEAVGENIGSIFKGGEPSDDNYVRCSVCGKELPKNAKFCMECGNKINMVAEQMICNVCREETPKGRFCVHCGAELL